MNKIGRIVTSNARIIIPPSSGASLKKRTKMSDELMDGFNQLVASEFEKNGYITRAKLEEAYKKLLPNVNLELVKIPKKLQKSSEAGLMHVIYLRNKSFEIDGFQMFLPFVKKNGEEILKAQHRDALFHETSHLTQYLTKPKHSVKMTNAELTYPLRHVISDFQDQLVILGRRTPVSSSKSKEIKGLTRQSYKNFFEESGVDSFQKIEFLQNCRHILKGEQIAYPQGLLYRGDYEKIPEVIGLKKNKNVKPEKKIAALKEGFAVWKRWAIKDYVKQYEDEFCFREKIAVTDSLLKAELKKVRKGFLATNKVTNPFVTNN